jgi:hypothetical protein
MVDEGTHAQAGLLGGAQGPGLRHHRFNRKIKEIDMYEIWLLLNIIWEIALSVWPHVLVAALVWLALMGTVWRTASGHWRAGLLPALLVGGAAAAAAFILVPVSLHSTLSDMGYWLDWATLFGIAAAVGGVVAVFIWPLLVWRNRRTKA